MSAKPGWKKRENSDNPSVTLTRPQPPQPQHDTTHTHTDTGERGDKTRQGRGTHTPKGGQNKKETEVKPF